MATGMNYGGNSVPMNAVDNDATLASNSDDRLPTQKAVKTYVDTQAALTDTLDELTLHGADKASAGTVNLETATGNLVDVTGTTTITAITLSEGHQRTVRFTGALTLTHGASLVLPGAANITTAAGDVAVFVGYASGVVRLVSYTKLAAIAVIKSATTVADVSYTAHASGATAVTSNAATDLDTTAAGLATLKTQFNALLAALRVSGVIAT